MRRRAHPRPWLVHCDCALGARRSKWGPLLPLLVRTVARLAEEKTDAGPTPRLAIAIVHARAFKHRCARGTERGGPSTDWVLAPTVLTQRPCPMKIGRRDCHLLAAWLSMLPKLANMITLLGCMSIICTHVPNCGLSNVEPRFPARRTSKGRTFGRCLEQDDGHLVERR